MKKLAMVFLLALVASVSFGQKRINSQDLKDFTAREKDFDEYLASEGHVYKVGDTLKIGRPSSNKTFAFIQEVALAEVINAGSEISGTNSIIKKIGVGGTKKSGFRVYITGKGICAICPSYLINVEEAISVGELKSFGMNRENAIAKLKEQKELFEIGMITKEEFEKIKTELTPYITGNSEEN